MNIKAFGILSVLCLTGASQFVGRALAGGIGDSESDLIRIYLPREVTISSAVASLGQVGIIRGSESLAARVGEIPLGRISAPNQEIMVDRAILLGRLACNGIPISKVTLTGALKTSIRREQQVIKGAKLVETASLFLEKHRPYPSVCRWTPVRTPRDFVVVGASEDIAFSPVVVRKGRSRVKVALVAHLDGREITAGEVTFRIAYKRRVAVTREAIAAGTVLSADNVKVEEIVSDRPGPADWQAPYGLAARRRLAAQCVIRSSMVGPVKPKKSAPPQDAPIIVKRNQTVLVRISRAGLLATAVGKALQKGRAGDYIKVKVQITEIARIIYAKVNQDGTVEPVF